MCQRFLDWESKIKSYCAKNGLSFEKASKMAKSSNKEMLVLQYFDENSESVKKGLGF